VSLLPFSTATHYVYKNLITTMALVFGISLLTLTIPGEKFIQAHNCMKLDAIHLHGVPPMIGISVIDAAAISHSIKTC
jgi:hypothetical protein